MKLCPSLLVCPCVWFKASAQISGVNEDGLNYLNIPSLMHAESVIAIFLAQAVNMGAAKAYPLAGSVGDFGQGLDNLYPGDAFDLRGLADDPTIIAELQDKEIKQGSPLLHHATGYLHFIPHITCCRAGYPLLQHTQVMKHTLFWLHP